MICKWIYSKCDRSCPISAQLPLEPRSTYNMFRFTPITDAKQIQRCFQQKRYLLPVPDYTSQLVVLLCENRYKSLGDSHEIRYGVF